MNSDRIWTLLSRQLAGEIAPEELAEMELVLRNEPLLRLKIEALTASWNQPQELANPQPEEAYEQLLIRLKEAGMDPRVPGDSVEFSPLTNPFRKRIYNRKKIVAGLVATILFTGTIFFWYQGGKNKVMNAGYNPLNTISTANGNRSKIELPDGSVVWLNAGSKLTYSKQFGNHLREVNLVGEAFFDVKHIAGKTFIIYTPNAEIKDLGTRFNVKCYAEDRTTETSLVEGSVEITIKKRPNERYILKPNEKLVLLNRESKTDSADNLRQQTTGGSARAPLIEIKKLTYLPEDSFSVETAWTYNKLSFEDEAFVDVAKKMGRWFDRSIEFRNKKFENIHLSVSFVNESFEQAIEALKYTNRFNYQIKDRQVIIY